MQQERCPNCTQSMADHISGCPLYPPLGTPGVTCQKAAKARIIETKPCDIGQAQDRYGEWKDKP